MREVVISVREARRFDPHVISMLVNSLAENNTSGNNDSIISEWLAGIKHKTVIETLLAHNCLVAAKRNGEIVGVISKAESGCLNPSCLSSGKKFVVRSLYIPVNHQGVGRMLLGAVEKSAQLSGISEVHTHIYQDHPFAEHFFVDNGWMKDVDTDIYVKNLQL